jgi:hypothetical protein
LGGIIGTVFQGFKQALEMLYCTFRGLCCRPIYVANHQ